MTKERYIQNQISDILRFWIRWFIILAISLFLFIGISDYFVAPQNFTRFLVYRLGISSLLLLLFYLNTLSKNIFYQYVIITAVVVFSAVTVELMIMDFGGHASPYYAGLNLVIIGALVLIPFNMPLAISMAVVIYGIYLVPIFLFDEITNVALFVSNNIFMIATFTIALTWRIFTQKAMLNELSLQYDLAEERNKLEQLVGERTRELRDSEHWHRSLFENATDGIMVLDQHGIIVNANDRACAMHGFAREALIGTNVSLLEADGGRHAGQERLRRLLAGEAQVYEAEHYRKDGVRIAVEVSAKAISRGDETFVQAFFRDVTEKKKIREQLMQSQKLESIGTLAGGIAHDFNNVLTAILGFTELIRREAGDRGSIISKLNVIERAARNAGRMISQLLGFARKSEFEMLSVDVNDVVRDTVSLLERVLDKRIAIGLELDASVPRIDGDIVLLEQVMMNLMVNARDAMPGGGKIRIATRRLASGEDALPPYVPPGTYVELAVSDTGTGIPEEIRRRIFEPFFTTKERGKGTGLGLSMVYGVITEHKGFISVQSEPGRGSTFTIHLPASAHPLPAPAQKPPPVVRGHETILAVDDDEEALAFIREALTLHGYRVIAVTSPQKALDAAKATDEHFSLMITDVVMPLMDGGELIRLMKALRPGMRHLTISGYSKYAVDSDELKAAAFLAKPFDSEHLVHMVRRILDAEHSAQV